MPVTPGTQTSSRGMAASAGVTADPVQRMLTSPAQKERAVPRRLRADEWTGYCPRCDADTVLTVTKADGRWTLRQLCGSSWEESDFEVVCRECGSTWPVAGSAMSLPQWLEQIRGTAGSDGD